MVGTLWVFDENSLPFQDSSAGALDVQMCGCMSEAEVGLSVCPSLHAVL